MALLKKIVQILPIAQRLAVRTLLAQRKKLGDIRTARQEVEEANRILDQISGRVGNQIFIPQFAIFGDRISSDSHNTNMEGLYIDISSLYLQVDSLSTAASSKAVAVQSDYLKSRAAVQRLITDARTFAIRKKFQKFTEIHIIDFNSARNVTTAVPSAQVDPKTRLLELRPLNSTRAHIANRLDRVTRIYTKTVSTGLKEQLSNNFPPEGMIDQKPETFWGTIVMTDIPTRQEYKLSNAKEIVVEGPVVEVYLRFSHIELLNVVRLLPFGDYPIDVIDIAYRPNSTSEIFYPVCKFDTETTLDWVEVNFPKIYAAELRISILQENPKQVLYHLPKALVINTDLFSHIIKIRAQKIIGSLFFDSDLSQELLKSQSQYQDALDDLGQLITQTDLTKSDIEEIDLHSDLMSALGLVLEQVDKPLGKDLLESEIVQDEAKEPLIEVRKYEYVLGVREIEAAYEIYAPTCFFESDRYLPQATLSSIQIEVDEERLESRNSWGPFFETSTEWSVDVGEGRILPIHPVNFTGTFSLPTALDERLDFDRGTATAFTRLGSATNDVLTLRRNGSILPKSGYIATRQIGTIPRMKVEVQEAFWDEDSIYTTDYEVSVDSYDLDLFTLLDPRPLGRPEVHEEVGPDNDIILSKFPFILYEVINRTGEFRQSPDQSTWNYSPPEPNISTGQIRIFPTVTDSIGQVLATGNITGQLITGQWGDQSGLGPFNTAGMNAAYFNDPEGFGYYSQIQDIRRNIPVSGRVLPTVHGVSGCLVFSEPPLFTQAQIQSMPSQATEFFDTTAFTGHLHNEFVLGVGLDINGRVFAFDDVTYVPIEVTIGGQASKNITDYVTLEHPAFTMANINDREYEYIHAGRRLYFNQPIKGMEIRVNYDWLTQHIKILSTLRCNKAINPDQTPKVDEIRLLMNTSIL